MQEVSLRDIFMGEYGILLQDEDLNRLVATFKAYNVNPENSSINVADSIDTLINNTQEFHTINIDRNEAKIAFDEVIFMLHPYRRTCTDEINVTIPRHVVHHFETDFDNPNQYYFTDNIVVIRTLYIHYRGEEEKNEMFTIHVYNNKLDVRAGVRFEQI